MAQEITRRYRKASKKEKGRILDEFCALTGYNRSYAAGLLRKGPPAKKKGKRASLEPVGSRRGRKPIYTAEVRKHLVKVWAIMDCPCGKRLAAAMPFALEALERFGEMRLKDEVRERLLSVSASTCDRLLASERQKLRLRSRHKTRPGSLLKHQIPVRTFREWDDARVGFLEADLVGHDGGVAGGDYCQSLDATDVRSGWTELRALRNKAQVWTHKAIDDIREKLPFPLLGLDSDNGSEFINAHLLRYCEEHQITFTRSRPYRKNDSCYVEQKNWTAVRKYVGYFRYDTEEQLLLLNQLYEVLCPYLNFFQPQARLVEKVREGSRIKKRYDEPKTPYQRILEDPEVDEITKRKLRRKYKRLNPAQLMREINSLQRKLFKTVVSGSIDPHEEGEQDSTYFE
ncbi:MAG: transposase family protein [Actinobacteria bacterium]|nr:transposase family protein [Actinomycetota bacterium]